MGPNLFLVIFRCEWVNNISAVIFVRFDLVLLVLVGQVDAGERVPAVSQFLLSLNIRCLFIFYCFTYMFIKNTIKHGGYEHSVVTNTRL